MEKLKELMSLCKASIELDINFHKDDYKSVNDYLHSLGDLENEDIDDDVRDLMIKNDTIIRLQFYPYTPIGCYVFYHYDLDVLLDEALNIFKNEV